MPKYRKKPVVIEAERWYPDREFIPFFSEIPGARLCRQDLSSLEIPTLEGTMLAGRGDWVIKGIKGEYYPCKAEIFASSYERVKE